LKFEEEPNYELIKHHITTMIEGTSPESGNKFDWDDRNVAIEKRSTFLHLSQHQLALKKTLDPNDNKYSTQF